MQTPFTYCHVVFCKVQKASLQCGDDLSVLVPLTLTPMGTGGQLQVSITWRKQLVRSVFVTCGEGKPQYQLEAKNNSR